MGREPGLQLRELGAVCSCRPLQQSSAPCLCRDDPLDQVWPVLEGPKESVSTTARKQKDPKGCSYNLPPLLFLATIKCLIVLLPSHTCSNRCKKVSGNHQCSPARRHHGPRYTGTRQPVFWRHQIWDHICYTHGAVKTDFILNLPKWS